MTPLFDRYGGLETPPDTMYWTSGGEKLHLRTSCEALHEGWARARARGQANHPPQAIRPGAALLVRAGEFREFCLHCCSAELRFSVIAVAADPLVREWEGAHGDLTLIQRRQMIATPEMAHLLGFAEASARRALSRHRLLGDAVQECRAEESTKFTGGVPNYSRKTSSEAEVIMVIAEALHRPTADFDSWLGQPQLRAVVGEPRGVLARAAIRNRNNGVEQTPITLRTALKQLRR